MSCLGDELRFIAFALHARAPNRDLDEQAVVMRLCEPQPKLHAQEGTHGDLSTSEPRAGIEADAVAACRAVDLDLTWITLSSARRPNWHAYRCQAESRQPRLRW
jgi:hypothetical protein